MVRTSGHDPEGFGRLSTPGGGGARLGCRSGNGVARDDVPVPLCPAEDMIESKSFVQEHERDDGAAVTHLRRRGEGLVRAFLTTMLTHG